MNQPLSVSFFSLIIILFLFIYFWLHWVFVAARGLSLVAASGGGALFFVVVHGLSCSTACGIFPDQGSNSFSPALAGGFVTTAPPGMSHLHLILKGILNLKPTHCIAWPKLQFSGTLQYWLVKVSMWRAAFLTVGLWPWLPF